MLICQCVQKDGQEIGCEDCLRIDSQCCMRCCMLCGMLVAMVTCELVAETEQTRTRQRKDGQYAVLPPISVDLEERDRMSSSEHNQYDIMMIDDIIIIINVDLYSVLSSKKPLMLTLTCAW